MPVRRSPGPGGRRDLSGRRDLRGLEVAILGTGKAGNAIAKALLDRGARVRIWSRSSRSSLESATRSADLVLVCVRDDAIESVAERLARSVSRSTEGRVALHLSGYHGTRPLRALASKGWSVGSIHPLVPLTGRASAADLEGAWFATSASGRAATLASQLVRGLAGHELRLRPGDRRKHDWHLACALVANGAVALFDAALERSGPGAAPALASMLGIVARRMENGARAALTGPVARGEVDVVAGHLALLRRGKDDARLYRLLSRRLLALAELEPSRRRAMARLLR
jgi:predicted short-subunit dehydrogenase-like oxidoreductase (DUF2520 family)